jgi:hypothetical protein
MKNTKFACLAGALLLTGLAGAQALRQKWEPVEKPGRARPESDGSNGEGGINYRREVADRRMEGKQQVTLDLIAGRLTLPEAAARFKVLNDTPADCPCRYDMVAEGKSPEERLCRQVINWAVTEVAQTSEPEALALWERLEAELQALRHRDGGVRLPESRE